MSTTHHIDDLTKRKGFWYVLYILASLIADPTHPLNIREHVIIALAWPIALFQSLDEGALLFVPIIFIIPVLYMMLVPERIVKKRFAIRMIATCIILTLPILYVWISAIITNQINQQRF